MDTARKGAGRLVEQANRQGPWLARGQRSICHFFLLTYMEPVFLGLLPKHASPHKN